MFSWTIKVFYLYIYSHARQECTVDTACMQRERTSVKREALLPAYGQSIDTQCTDDTQSTGWECTGFNLTIMIVVCSKECLSFTETIASNAASQCGCACGQYAIWCFDNSTLSGALVAGSGIFQQPGLAGLGYWIGLGFWVVFTIIVSLTLL